MIHPTAEVEGAIIGEGTQIWQHCVVLPGARVGNDCNVNAHCLIEGDVVVGNRVTLKCGVYLWSGVTLEDDVFVGPNVTFTNDLQPRAGRRPDAWIPTLVRRGASIGGGVTIVAGITVGAHAMIGAGSVVTRDVPAHELWFGNPARFRGGVCACGAKLAEDLHCVACGMQYARAVHGGYVSAKGDAE